MKITSTNIAKPTTILFNDKGISTGIYKTPVKEPLFLGKENVKDDEISDLKVHGGEFKACYLYASNHYPYWQNSYPHLNWQYGMLGENLTVTGLDETQLIIGSIYKVGGAIIQITQPREPCFKLGVKFGTQEVLKQFIDYGYSGTYVRILEEGFVKTGDNIILVESAKNSLTTFEFFKLLFSKEKDQKLLKIVIENHAIPLKKRLKLKTFID